MSFMNNNSKTIDGQNTFNADIFNCNLDFEVNGFKGAINQYLHKAATNNALEWVTFNIADNVTPGYCVDVSGQTISVDLSELTTGTGAAITDYIPIIRITG